MEAKLSLFIRRFGKTKFVQTESPEIARKFKLSQKKLFTFVDQANKGSIHLDLSKRPFEGFVLNKIFMQYANISDKLYDVERKHGGLVFVLLAASPSFDQQFMFQYLDLINQNTLPIDFKICILSNRNCRLFIDRVGPKKFPKSASPLGFLLNAKDDLVYLFDEGFQKTSKGVRFSSKKLGDFLEKAKSKKIAPSVFSEPEPNHRNLKIKSVTFEGFEGLVADSRRELKVVLFYDSRECLVPCSSPSSEKQHCFYTDKKKKTRRRCEDLLYNFQTLGNKMMKMTRVKERKVAFRIYDIGNNSYYHWKVRGAPVVRFYSKGKVDKFEEMGVHVEWNRWFSEALRKVLSLSPSVDSEL